MIMKPSSQPKADVRKMRAHRRAATKMEAKMVSTTVDAMRLGDRSPVSGAVVVLMARGLQILIDVQEDPEVEKNRFPRRVGA